MAIHYAHHHLSSEPRKSPLLQMVSFDGLPDEIIQKIINSDDAVDIQKILSSGQSNTLLNTQNQRISPTRRTSLQEHAVEPCYRAGSSTQIYYYIEDSSGFNGGTPDTETLKGCAMWNPSRRWTLNPRWFPSKWINGIITKLGIVKPGRSLASRSHLTALLHRIGHLTSVTGHRSTHAPFPVP
ncbi:hypothetical protein P691DRAFT_787955, partial [Macrolepiota fuliginosa MF-IS2]